MSRTLYSYKDCLTYFLGLLRKHHREEFFLSKHEELYHSLVILCGSSPATFWACLQKQWLDRLKYEGICQKIRSYLVRKEPLSYITGECLFFGIPVKTRKGVFTPQPDTEALVSAVLSLSKKIWSSAKKNRVLEIGCGSGNIAITLASKNLSWSILAVDNSRKALSLAKKNALELSIFNIQFLFSNRFSKVTGKFHIVVSNPPYISPSEYRFLDQSTKKQPKRALLSANNGYFFYESIIRKVSLFLMKRFLVAFEIGHSQEERVIKIIIKYFPHVKVEIFKDFSWNTRVVAFYQQ